MPVKDKSKLKGKLKKKGKATGKAQVVKIIVQAAAPKSAPFKTGMNRDIPMGGAGGSPNLLANLLASRQQQPAAQPIQTPDQFNLAQDVRNIKEDIQRQRREYPIEIPQNEKVKIKVVKELQPDAQIIGPPKKEYSAGGAKKDLAQELYDEHGISVDIAPLREQANPMRAPQLAEAPGRLTMAPADFSHSLVGEDGGGFDEITGDYFGQADTHLI